MFEFCSAFEDVIVYTSVKKQVRKVLEKVGIYASTRLLRRKTKEER